MSFTSMTQVTACAKPHRCHWCGERIEKGQPATKVAGVWDGDFGQSYYHPECDAVLQSMDWKELEQNGVDDAFEEGLFKRGTKEPAK